MELMTKFERRQTILRLLKEHPGIKVTSLADNLDVSEGTIRNDLTALEQEQKVQRVHGGAVLVEQPETAFNVLSSADIVNGHLKQRIARWAAELVQDGDTIFLDASTTVYLMAPSLRERRRLTIVTSGLQTAYALAKDSEHTVILVGGVVSRSGNATTSLIGLDMLHNLHIQTAYVSGVGFDVQAGLTERHIEEAQLKQEILASIPRIVALMSSNKIGSVSTQPFVSPERITHLFTDSNVSAEFIEQMRRAHINLTICGQNTVRSFNMDADKHQFTIGFANQSEKIPFTVDVRRSLERAAASMGSIDLVVADNQLSGEEALRVADRLIARHIDLAIEYQIDYKAGNLIMNKFQESGIPVIAVDIPMVGATFFGVDNYRAGQMAGKALGEWIDQNWDRCIDYLLVLEEPRAGSLPEARIQGQLDGLYEFIDPPPAEHIYMIDSGNTRTISETGVTHVLDAIPDARRIAIVSFNDEAAYGALHAARKANREKDVVMVGQGADRLVHAEIRSPRSRLIGSTAYMPEKYGNKLMELALKILRGESVPPAVYIDHVFIDASNIDRYYPPSS